MTRYNPNRLYKDTKNAKVMGVCAGIADYFDIKVCVVRFLTILGILFTSGWLLIAYFIMGLVLDPKPEELYEKPQDDEFWRQARTKPDYTTVDMKRRFENIDKRMQKLEAYLTSKKFRLDREIKGLED